MLSATRRCLGVLDKLAAIAHDRQMPVARQTKSSDCCNRGDTRAAGTSMLKLKEPETLAPFFQNKTNVLVTTAFPGNL